MIENEKITILVIDDDDEIRKSLKKLLETEKYNVLTGKDGIEALDLISTNKIHLLIIDVMMPKLDGLSATMKIREKDKLPIIILSAKTENSDKILGLRMGADDYITKPFNSEELLARVNSLLRRYISFGSINTSDSIINGRLQLNKSEKQLYADEEKIKLTATEYKIVDFLMSNLGIVFSAEKIYEEVWKEDSFSAENTVMVHIRRIREKIEINSKEPDYLKVVWGIGYKMEKHG